MDNNLVEKAERLFIQKQCFPNAAVQAAVITAASKMALASGIVGEEVVLEEMIEAYEAGDNEKIKAAIGMAPSFASELIGYDVPYDNPALAKPHYIERKDEYDFFYTTVLLQHKLKETKQENIKKAI